METARREKLEGHLSQLRHHRQVLEEASKRPEPFDVEIEIGPVQRLHDALVAVEEDFPDLLPKFDMTRYLIFRSLKGRPYYKTAELQTYLNDAIARAEQALQAG